MVWRVSYISLEAVDWNLYRFVGEGVNAHLLVFVGHLIVAVYPAAVGCGLV